VPGLFGWVPLRGPDVVAILESTAISGKPLKSTRSPAHPKVSAGSWVSETYAFAMWSGSDLGGRLADDNSRGG